MEDSAGVAVVTNRLDFYRPTWEIGREVTHIGGDDLLQDPNYEFYHVRDVALTGSLVIVAESDGTIRTYTHAGAFVRRIGALGEGPGELKGVTWVRAVESAVWTYDPVLRRVTTFDTSGQYVRSWDMRPIPDFGEHRVYRAVGVGVGDRYIIAARDAAGPAQLGVVRPQSIVADWEVGAGSEWQIGPFPGDERSRTSANGAVYLGVPPFARELLLDMDGGDRVVVVDTGEPLIRIFVDGRLTVSSRLEGSMEREVTERLVDDYIEDQTRLIPDRPTRERVASNIREAVRHTHTPIFQSLVLGSDGTLWLQRYNVSLMQRQFWMVTDSAGRVQGTVELPETYTLAAVGNDVVAVVTRSPYTDVQAVKLLERPR